MRALRQGSTTSSPACSSGRSIRPASVTRAPVAASMRPPGGGWACSEYSTTAAPMRRRSRRSPTIELAVQLHRRRTELVLVVNRPRDRCLQRRKCRSAGFGGSRLAIIANLDRLDRADPELRALDDVDDPSSAHALGSANQAGSSSCSSSYVDEPARLVWSHKDSGYVCRVRVWTGVRDADAVSSRRSGGPARTR